METDERPPTINNSANNEETIHNFQDGDTGDPCSLSVVERLEEEERIRQEQLARHQQQAETNLYSGNPGHSRRKKYWKVFAFVACLVLLAAETVFGVLAGSIVCITDVLRLLSDYLGQYAHSERGSAAFRRLECVLLLIGVLVLWAADIVFVVAAANRIFKPDYKIDATYMLIGAVFSLTANCLLIILHLVDSFHPRRYVTMSDFISVRVQQTAHAIGNHGTGLIVFIAAVLIYIQPEWKVVDSISSFVMVLLMLCNTAAVVNACYAKLRKIGTRREAYQSI